MDFTQVKLAIAHYTGLEKDALHIHAALFIYILAALLLRRTRHSLIPWLIVFGIELANEAHDFRDNWGAPLSWAIGESAKDLWNTMLWPSVLLIAGRYTRWFLPRQSGRAAPDDLGAPAGSQADSCPAVADVRMGGASGGDPPPASARPVADL